MRQIKVEDISLKVEEMLLDACENIPCNVLNALKEAYKTEQSPLAKEVINKIIEFAFTKLKIHRLEAKVMIENISSNKLFKSLNFNYEGIIHSSVKKNNNFFDVNSYYLINNL